MTEEYVMKQESTTFYIANDGKKFTNPQECKEYEYFLSHIDNILSKIIFLHYDEETKVFTHILPSNLGYFDYCFLKEATYCQYHKFFKYYNTKFKDFEDIDRVGFYHRDYSSAFQGGYNRNGWFYLGSKDKIILLHNLLMSTQNI